MNPLNAVSGGEQGAGLHGVGGIGGAHLLEAGLCTPTFWAQLSASKNSTGKMRTKWADPEASGVGRAAWGPMGQEQKFGQTLGSRARSGPWGTLTRFKMGTVSLSASPQSGAGQQPIGGMACGSQSPRAAPNMAQPKGDPVPCPRQTPVSGAARGAGPTRPALTPRAGVCGRTAITSPTLPGHQRRGLLGDRRWKGGGRSAPDGTPGL